MPEVAKARASTLHDDGDLSEGAIPLVAGVDGIRRLFVRRLPPKAPERCCKRSWAAGMIGA
jgi:hypothetical protein